MASAPHRGSNADAEGHGELLDLREARSLHHVHHLLAANERVHALGEIFVSAGFVPLIKVAVRGRIWRK